MKKIIMLTVAILIVFSSSISASAFGSLGIFSSKPVEEVETEKNKTEYVSLMYHKISKDPNEHNAFCISPETFEADIQYLKNEGYRFCTPGDINAIKENKWEKCVFITFDDGYESDYVYALPILEKYGAKATFFVIGSQIGKDDHITKSHLEIMAKSECVEIGSHSYEIHNKSPEEIKELFDSSDIKQIRDDYIKNKECLEKITNKPIISLSYPNGIWNSEADKALRDMGVLASFTSEEALITDLGAPFGRYNRSFDRTPEQLIAKAYNIKIGTPESLILFPENTKHESNQPALTTKDESEGTAEHKVPDKIIEKHDIKPKNSDITYGSLNIFSFGK